MEAKTQAESNNKSKKIMKKKKNMKKKESQNIIEWKVKINILKLAS